MALKKNALHSIYLFPPSISSSLSPVRISTFNLPSQYKQHQERVTTSVPWHQTRINGRIRPCEQDCADQTMDQCNHAYSKSFRPHLMSRNGERSPSMKVSWRLSTRLTLAINLARQVETEVLLGMKILLLDKTPLAPEDRAMYLQQRILALQNG